MTTIKSIRNLCSLKKDNEAIKDQIIRNIRIFFEQEKEDSFKRVTVGNFRSRNILNMKAMEIEIKVSIKEYLNKFRPYLRYFINDLKKSDLWKNQ